MPRGRGLALLGSRDGANARASAAGNAGVRIDGRTLPSPSEMAEDRALLRASAARDAIVAENIIMGITPPCIWTRSLYNAGGQKARAEWLTLQFTHGIIAKKAESGYEGKTWIKTRCCARAPSLARRRPCGATAASSAARPAASRTRTGRAACTSPRRGGAFARRGRGFCPHLHLRGHVRARGKAAGPAAVFPLTPVKKENGWGVKMDVRARAHVSAFALWHARPRPRFRARRAQGGAPDRP